VKKFIGLLFCFSLFSCANLMRTLSGVGMERDDAAVKIRGMRPVEAKNFLGTPVFEGLSIVDHKAAFVLIYTDVEQSQAGYNLNKGKRCFSFFFNQENGYKLKDYGGSPTHGPHTISTDVHCSLGALAKRYREMSAEDFESKYIRK